MAAAAGDIFSSQWEHPVSSTTGSTRSSSFFTDDDGDGDTRFSNGSNRHLDQSPSVGDNKNGKRSPKVGSKLKDPPQQGKIQRRQPTTRLIKAGPHAFSRDKMIRKPPSTRALYGDSKPPSLTNRSCRSLQSGGVVGLDDYVVDSIPMSPMRTNSSHNRHQKSLEDASNNTFPTRPGKKPDPGIPLVVRPTLLTDISYRLDPSSRTDLASEEFYEQQHSGSNSRRRHEEEGYDHARRRHCDAGPPPSSRYEDDYSGRPPPMANSSRRSYQGDSYSPAEISYPNHHREHHHHRQDREPRYNGSSSRQFDYRSSSRDGNSRSHIQDSGARLENSRSLSNGMTRPRYDDDNHDNDRLQASQGSRYYEDPHLSNRRHLQDRYPHGDRSRYHEDDNISHASRSSNIRRSDGERSIGGRLQDDDVSQCCSRTSSRYPDDVSRSGRHHLEDYPDNVSRSSRHARNYPEDVSVASRNRHPADRRYDLQDYGEASRASLHSRQPPRGRYEEDKPFRFDKRGGGHEDDDGRPVRSTYSRHSHHRPPQDLHCHDSFSRDQTYPTNHGRQDDPYSRLSRPDPRKGDYDGRRNRRMLSTQEEDSDYERQERSITRAPRNEELPGLQQLIEVGEDSTIIRDAVYVEIGVGVEARLRRTKETVDAIARGFYASAPCFACTTDLFCIADVEFVICPQCKTISPAEGGTPVKGAVSIFETMQCHGIGLGFTHDTLLQMQSILAKGDKP